MVSAETTVGPAGKTPACLDRVASSGGAWRSRAIDVLDRSRRSLTATRAVRRPPRSPTARWRRRWGTRPRHRATLDLPVQALERVRRPPLPPVLPQEALRANRSSWVASRVAATS